MTPIKEDNRFARHFLHTKRRFSERYRIHIGKNEYIELIYQIRRGGVQTSISRHRHLVFFEGNVYVVIYKDGLIRTVYPQEFPIPKQKKHLFLQQFEAKYGTRD